MIIKGVRNLRTCAWIGEEDSLEEREQLIENIHKSLRNDDILRYEQSEQDDPLSSLMNAVLSKAALSKVWPVREESHERIQQIDSLVQTALGLSKNKLEVLNSLYRHSNSRVNASNYVDIVNQTSKNSENTYTIIDSNAKSPDKDNGFTNDDHANLKMLENLLNLNVSKTSAEDIKNYIITRRIISRNHWERSGRSLDSDEIEAIQDETERRNLGENFTRPLSLELIKQDGMNYKKGTVNQTDNRDLSAEESQSSYSSSEEALASCNGVLATQSLEPDLHCTQNHYHNLFNKISHTIAETDTYYFVFSSDNEIVDNFLYFNLTLNRYVYDTGKAITECINTTSCSLPLRFWSDDQAVVEVPYGDNWDEFYILHTKCEPRVSLYLSMLILVPILILCCALR